MSNLVSVIVTLSTAVIGWVVILFLHAHILRRDEVSRKKDRLQNDLNSLLLWALDTDMLRNTPSELREVFLAGKLSSVEARHDELYGQYFKIVDEANHISGLRDIEVYGLKDDVAIKDFQVDIIYPIMLLNDSIEDDYGNYCRESWLHRKICKRLVAYKIHCLVLAATFLISYFISSI